MEDGSRHTKWMKAMMPRLQVMKSMLKPNGVLAICIDDNELFHLGMMLDEVFGEENRIALINWQKTSSKNDAGHVGKTTEYVLVYAREADRTQTGLVATTAKAASRFGNLDSDAHGRWKQGDATAREQRSQTSYGIQSPFNGLIHYPGNRHWANVRKQMREWLEGWGSAYEDCDLGDKKAKALVLKGFSPEKAELTRKKLLARARQAAERKLAAGNWPRLYFGMSGDAKPVLKVYEDEVKAGTVPVTFWDEDFDVPPEELGCVSWNYFQTGRSREGTEEFRSIAGTNHVFETIKPLKLIKKLIQLWSPPDGLILDPYAGSGTTGHAVLEINKDAEAQRRFILIEQGRPENGDRYARTLTWTRLKRAITGERPDKKGRVSVTAEPLGGGFEFRALTSQIDAKTVLSMKRDELVDVIITSHWETSTRHGPGLVRLDDSKYTYLVGRNEENEGYFIIWNGDGPVGQLDLDTYKQVLQEGKRAGLKVPYHVYARYEVYQTRHVIFYKIPDRILAHLGLNESTDSYNDPDSD